jgi:hypothetical protein
MAAHGEEAGNINLGTSSGAASLLIRCDAELAGVPNFSAATIVAPKGRFFDRKIAKKRLFLRCSEGGVLEGKSPHPSTSLMAGFLAKDARNGAPGRAREAAVVNWHPRVRCSGL